MIEVVISCLEFKRNELLLKIVQCSLSQIRQKNTYLLILLGSILTSEWFVWISCSLKHFTLHGQFICSSIVQRTSTNSVRCVVMQIRHTSTSGPSGHAESFSLIPKYGLAARNTIVICASRKSLPPRSLWLIRQIMSCF